MRLGNLRWCGILVYSAMWCFLLRSKETILDFLNKIAESLYFCKQDGADLKTRKYRKPARRTNSHRRLWSFAQSTLNACSSGWAPFLLHNSQPCSMQWYCKHVNREYGIEARSRISEFYGVPPFLIPTFTDFSTKLPDRPIRCWPVATGGRLWLLECSYLPRLETCFKETNDSYSKET